MSTAADTRPPRPVLAALALSWSALLLMVGGSVVYISTSATPVPLGDIAVALLGYALIATVLLAIARANSWARIVFLILLAWSVGLFVINVVLESRQLLGLVLVDIVAMSLQLCALVLLFQRSSEQWFRGPAPSASGQAPRQ